MPIDALYKLKCVSHNLALNIVKYYSCHEYSLSFAWYYVSQGVWNNTHTHRDTHKYLSLLTSDHTDAVKLELLVMIDTYVNIVIMLYQHYLLCSTEW